MDKIASPADLQAELRKLLAYAESDNPSRVKLAAGLSELAVRVAATKQFIGKAGRDNWAVKIDGVDSTFPHMNFGRQIDEIRKVNEWLKGAKTGYVDAKGKATLGAVKKWIREVRPKEFYAKWGADSSSYKDDSVEIAYKK